MENIKKESIDMFLRTLISVGGVDIVAPKELQDSTLKSLGLTGDEDLEYQAIAKILNNMALDKRVKVLRAAVANTLTPSQMMEVGYGTRDDIKNVLEYLEKHPEAREKVDSEEAVKRILGSDFDVD